MPSHTESVFGLMFDTVADRLIDLVVGRITLALSPHFHALSERISHMNQQLQAAIDGVKASVDTASATASAESADISAKLALVIQGLPTSGATQADVDSAVAQLQAIQAQTDALTTSIGNLSDAVVAPSTSSEPTG